MSVAGNHLAARLRELAASAGSLEDALVPMLEAIKAATGATAGALCLYDVRQQALCLAGEIGLSDEGRGKLRIIARRGEGDSWGIPLHGMLNRRCYLIEHAARNRFVPPLIPDPTTIETVACLPVYGGDAPLASLILVTRAPRTLGERELHGIEAPVYELGRLIETMRQRVADRESKPPTPASMQTVPVDARAGIASAPAADVPSASVAAEIARVAHERDRVAAELETLRRDAREKTQAHAATLERLRLQLGEAEAEVAHAQRAREELEARVAAAQTGRLREMQTALASERDRLAVGLERMVAARTHLLAASKAALAEATTHLHEARSQAWDVAARLVQTEATREAAREEYESRIAYLTGQLATLREELSDARASSVDTVRINARAMALQRARDLRNVVRELEGCADVIDGIPLTGAEPLRQAAARFAHIASAMDADTHALMRE